MASLYLKLLGGFQACSPRNVVIAIPVKKAKALLAYLALHPGQLHLRDKLAALLWEDSNDTRARHSLRQALVCLRKAFPAPAHVIQANDDGLTISPRAIEVDVLEFECLADRATPEALEQVVALYQGELLEGFNPGSSGFEDWLMERRGRLRERAIQAAETLLVRQLADRPGERAITLALRLVSWDPLRESAQRTLMELYVRSGRHGAALKQYQRCRTVLRRELGVEPEPQTQALHQTLLNQRRAAAIPSPSPPSPDPGKPAESAGLANDRLHPASRHERGEESISPGSTTGLSPLEKGEEEVELRQSSLLMARTAVKAGEPLDLEERHAARQDLLARAHAAGERFGGCLIQTAPDAVMVVFGIPQAHGNDAERAARAALAIQQADADADPSSHRRPIRIGLASGPVLASRWGAADTHGYMVTGDAVQEADRGCAQAGPTEIVMSEALYASLREWVAAEALSPGESAHPSRFWRLRALREEPRFEQSAFIGRRGPLRQFAGALESCHETGCGQTLLVRGEAGIGKTRLVEECAGLARTHGFSCHRVLILDFGVAIGQDALQLLVRGVLGLNASVPLHPVSTGVARMIAAGMIENTQDVFLHDLLGLPLPAVRQPEYDAMRHEARQQGKQAVMAQVIAAAAAQHPLLLVIEDIHWADATTLDGVARIATVTRENPVMLVMTSRLEGEPLDPTWRGAMHGASLFTLDLGPLRAEEALALTQQFDPLDADQVARCLERAGGNPLFLEQLLRAAQVGDAHIPHSVQSLVWVLLDRLTPPDRAAAQAASIMGQRFTIDALRHVIQDPAYRCDPLIEHRLARRDSEGYLFAHVLIQEGIYASLRKTRQRELHRRAATWFADRDSRLHAEHLDRAGDPTAAQAYWVAAREQATGHRLDLAAQLAGRGQALAGDAPTAHALACLHGDLLRETGSIDESIAAFEQALTQAPTGANQARAWIGVAHGRGIQDRYAEALEALDQAEQVAESTDNAGLLAQIHYQRGNLSFPMGRIDACFREHERALQYARAADSPVLEARALSGLGDACYQRGRMLSAHRHFDQCIALCHQRGLAGLEAPNLAMRGLTRFYQNDLMGAEQDGRLAVDIAARLGNKRDESLALNMLGLVYQHMDRWPEAGEVIGKSLELARVLGARQFEAENLGNLAFVTTKLGQSAQAERWLEQAWALSRATGAAYVGSWLLSLWALVTEDAARRSALLKEGEALLGADSVSHNHLHFHQNAMEAALTDCDWPAVERHAAALADYTAAEPLPWSEFFITRGRALARHGHGERSPELTTILRALHEHVESVGLLVAAPALRAALDELRRLQGLPRSSSKDRP